MAPDSSARNPNGFLVFLGSLAALLLVALILIFSIARGTRPDSIEKERGARRLAAREKLDHESAEILNGEGWVDKDKGLVHVPVSRVFPAVVESLRAKKAAASNVKVEAPLPMPVADPASTEPPPMALPSAPQGADTVHFSASAPMQAAPAANATGGLIPIEGGTAVAPFNATPKLDK